MLMLRVATREHGTQRRGPIWVPIPWEWLPFERLVALTVKFKRNEGFGSAGASPSRP